MTTEKEQREEGEEINLRKTVAGFFNRWHYFAISIAVFIAGGFLYIKLTLPVFRAESSILVKDSKLASQNNIEDLLNGDVFSTTRNLSTEIGIIQSRGVLLEAASQLRMQVSYFGYLTFSRVPLYKDSPFGVDYENVHPVFYDIPFIIHYNDDTSFELSVEADFPSANHYSYTGKHRYEEKISTPYFSLVIHDNKSSREKKSAFKEYEFIIHSDEQLEKRIENNLKVFPLNKDATIIVATYHDNIKERAKDFLNALSSGYIQRDINDKSSVATLTLKFIDEQLGDKSKELSANESDLQEYKEHNKTINLSEESKNFLERLNALDAERVKAELELRSLNYLLEYVSSEKDISQLAPSGIGTPDQSLVLLITQLQMLQNKKRNLEYGAKEISPVVKVIDSQIEDTRALLIENIKNIRGRTEINLSGINKELKQFEESIKHIPSIERELIGLQRKFDVNQNIYLYLLQKKAETGIARATVVSDNKVLDEASASDVPVKPDLKLVMTMCLLLGLLLPAFGILLLDYLQNKISSRDEIERLTKIPVLGIVGHMRETGERLVVHSRPKSSIAESFRSIRTNLAYFGMNEKNNVILITSSVGGEGKSFTAINLASVLSLQNNKIIIVAFDLRKSQLFLDFGVENKKGVSTFLIGQSSLDEIIHHTRIPNLDFISSGPVPPNPAELISKDECASLINTLKQNYDYVIIDTPPIGIVADALLLMKYSNLNVFILRQKYSRKENLKQINEYFNNGIIKHVSILFNDAGKSNSYGYGYGYYDDEHKKKNFFQRLFRRS